MIIPFRHLHATNAALLHYFLRYCYNLNGCLWNFQHFIIYQICSISFKDATDNKTRCSWRNQVTGISLTTLMFLWTPSKILVSLAQSLKLSLRKSSTQKAKASWGLLRTWWRAVTKMFGGAKKRWRGEKSEQLKYIIHKIYTFSINKDNNEGKVIIFLCQMAVEV